MTRKSKARYGLGRTYRISPTVKALRAAMMAGLLAAAPVVCAAPPADDFAIEQIQNGDVSISNPADLYAEAIYTAAGIVGVSYYGNIDISNSGDITASAGYYTGSSATAVGIYAEAGADVYLENSGVIIVSADASDGGQAVAAGIYVSGGNYDGSGTVLVQNQGDITVSAYSETSALAIGIGALATDGNVWIDNYGSIDASSVVGAEDYFSTANSTGIMAYSENGVVGISNSGDITVSASVEDNSGFLAATASATGISATAYAVSIRNTGDITATANNNVYLGEASVTGIEAETTGASWLVISNYGDIDLSGSSGDGYYRGGSYPDYLNLHGDFLATGINATSTDGSIDISNSGAITITNLNPDGGFSGSYSSGDTLTGISANTLLGNSFVTNNGDISLTGGEVAYGIVASTSSKTVYYACPPPYDNGNYTCYNRYGGGDARVTNSGDIDIYAGVAQYLPNNFAVGISVSTGKYGGSAVVQNSGDIYITVVSGGSATGITAMSSGKYSNGNSVIANDGDITVSASENARGIVAYSENTAQIINNGDITATAENLRASGLYAIADDFGYIRNTGSITATGGIGANGIATAANYGAQVLNYGDVSVTSTQNVTYYNSYYGAYYTVGGWAYGVAATARFIGTASVVNHGDVQVDGITQGVGLATLSRFGSAFVYNSGELDVNGALYSAYGIRAQASGLYEFLYGETGYSTVLNNGDITVTGGNMAVGIQADQFYGDVQIYNTGAITATVADDSYGSAIGLAGLNGYGNVDIINQGDLSISSSGNAGGIVAESIGYAGYYYDFPGNVNVWNAGDITVRSNRGRATGINADSRHGDVYVAAGGQIDVSAFDLARGINADSDYGNVEIYSVADIRASSSAYHAAGIRGMAEYGDVLLFNYGDVTVNAAGLSQGLVALSYYGNVGIRNEGDVIANSSAGFAQSVALRSAEGANAVLRNHGSISAGTGNALAISIAKGHGVISNYGDIYGGILADNGDDYIRNYSGGRMFLSNDNIDLRGGSNYFLNQGRLYANGSSNLINMGYSVSELGSIAGLFVNDGNSIHMDDGVADDTLSITGNFSGNGDVNVDVNGASGISDILRINGNVLAGTNNSVNVNLLSLPSAAALAADNTITVVDVNGSSAVGNFSLGQVQSSFEALFTVDYQMVREGSDFALAIDVTGLSTTGVLLANASPAIQNLWFGSLGTMYQRQGAARSFLVEGGAAEVKGAAGSWVRFYGNSGDMSPQVARTNFGTEGAHDYSFRNDGFEFGIGYSFSDAWTAGVFGGLVDGSYRPSAGGRGRIDANTLGAYLTYTPGNGWYADFSYRDSNVDGQAQVDGAIIPFSGGARGYALELGYAFRMQSGLEIEPQLQYAHMDTRLATVEFNAGDFALTDGGSDQLRAGIALRRAFDHGKTVWTPYGSLNYVDVSSAPNRYLIGDTLSGTVQMDGSSMLLEMGADVDVGALVFNLGLNYQDGGAHDAVYGGQFNVRYTW